MTQSLNSVDKIYHEIIADALKEGTPKGDRTGTGTKAVVGRMARFDLRNRRVPRLTTKPVISMNPEEEMFWFVSGDTNIKALRDKNIGIWNSWLMPGTAVHEDLDYDKLNAAICKKLKVASFTIELQCADTMADLHLTAFTSAVQVVEFRREGNPPTAVIAIEQPIWAACVSNEGYGVSLENAQVAIAKALGVATTRLVSGDIGKGGYGAQWRNLEDTQMIPACDRADYIAQGYTIVGNLNSSVGADYRDWDLKGKIKQAIFTKLDEVNVVDFVEGCDDVDEFNDNTYKYRTERACNVMTVYYSGYRALQELYKALYDIPTLVAHRKIDQLQNAIDLLKSDPDSRRIIVSAWNPALTWKAALPPCHLYFQFISLELTVMQRVAIYNDRTDLAQRDHARNSEQSFVTWEHLHVDSWLAAVADSSQAELENLHKELDERQVARRGLYCFLLLRSNDLGLGMPFNITQYAALTHMVAQLVGMESIELVWSAVDAHVYNDHVAGLTEQLQRDSVDAIPRLVLDKKVTNIDDFNIGSIELIDYKSQPPLTNKMLPSV